MFSKKIGVHSHQAVKENILNRHKISNSVKRKATDSTSEKPAKMIHKEIERQPDTIKKKLTAKDLVYIRKNITHTKLKDIPKLPKSAAEVQTLLEKIEVRSVSGESMLCVNDMELKIVIFSCESNIKFMCRYEMLYMDGTFDYCAKHFLQLFCIHVLSNEV